MKNEVFIQDELKLALIQFEPVWENAEANCELLQDLLEDLETDTDVVIPVFQ
jgi:archaellum biogenesis ATPase FlaH